MKRLLSILVLSIVFVMSGVQVVSADALPSKGGITFYEGDTETSETEESGSSTEEPTPETGTEPGKETGTKPGTKPETTQQSKPKPGGNLPQTGEGTTGVSQMVGLLCVLLVMSYSVRRSAFIK